MYLNAMNRLKKLANGKPSSSQNQDGIRWSTLSTQPPPPEPIKQHFLREFFNRVDEYNQNLKDKDKLNYYIVEAFDQRGKNHRRLSRCILGYF